MKKIALLGATGYIGKSLAHRFSKESEYTVDLFSRADSSIDRFGVQPYDMIINCIGKGNPSSIAKNPMEVVSITEKIDALILKNLEKNPQSISVNFSSGVVYAANKKPDDYYRQAKVDSEARHRSMQHLNIVDIRLFSFFSQFIDLNSGFLLAEIINCVKNGKVFETTDENIVRDYVGPDDLFSFIELLIKKPKINDFFDIYSLKPITKFELLDFFKENYGLKIKYIPKLVTESPTGSKSEYFSKSKKAETLGYIPKYTSLQVVQEEVKNIL